jgi:hypothetical protein
MPSGITSRGFNNREFNDQELERRKFNQVSGGPAMG